MFKKSNIFHLIPSFYPDIGGAEKQLERLSIEQRKAGYNVNIITRKSKKNNNVDSKKFKTEISRKKTRKLQISHQNRENFVFYRKILCQKVC